MENGGLRDEARRWKEILKGKCSGCGPLAELPSAAPGTREGSGMRLVGADAHVGISTREGQGVKTKAVDASEKTAAPLLELTNEIEGWNKNWNHASYTAGAAKRAMSYSPSSEV